MTTQRLICVATILGTVAVWSGAPVRSQVGQGLLDVNTASVEQLTALPHMTDEIVERLIGRRPFSGIIDLNASLLKAGLNAKKAAEFYGKAFIHVNLNTGSKEEILLIPGAGGRMAHEFDEYRPWKNWAHFDREIGKYVDESEVSRLKQYVFVPIDLNTASDEAIQSIPGVGRRMVHEFKEYRPWKTKEQFEREIGKYVDKHEVARLWRYVTIR
jgi:DNA uptake protein ComE-like DNA-binding protein